MLIDDKHDKCGTLAFSSFISPVARRCNLRTLDVVLEFKLELERCYQEKLPQAEVDVPGPTSRNPLAPQQARLFDQHGAGACSWGMSMFDVRPERPAYHARCACSRPSVRLASRLGVRGRLAENRRL